MFHVFGILFLPNWLALFSGSLWMEDVHAVVQSWQQHLNAESDETKKNNRKVTPFRVKKRTMHLPQFDLESFAVKELRKQACFL